MARVEPAPIPTQSYQVAASLTQLLLSLFPFNQLLKLYHLAPRKHKHNQHHHLKRIHAVNSVTTLNDLPENDADDQQQTTTPQLEHRTAKPELAQMQTSTTNLITDLAQRNRRRLMHRSTPTFASTTAKPHHHQQSRKPSSTRLPRVTHADLYNLHQIHAASLNGLAGQQQPASSPPAAALNEIQSFTPSGEQQNGRKPAQQPSNISPFVQALPPPSSTNLVDLGGQGEPRPPQMQSRPPQQQPPARGPQIPASSTPASQRQQQQSNRFSVAPVQTQTSTTIGGIGGIPPLSTATTTSSANNNSNQHQFDSSPLATTNSISVHHNQPGLGSSTTTGQPQLISSSSASAASGLSSTSLAPPTYGTLPSHNNNILHHSLSGNGGNVLASSQFNPPPVRASSHNSLANSKNSLDGIIAVAIFGGFIFLGAIITILVIIVRR